MAPSQRVGSVRCRPKSLNKGGGPINRSRSTGRVNLLPLGGDGTGGGGGDIIHAVTVTGRFDGRSIAMRPLNLRPRWQVTLFDPEKLPFINLPTPPPPTSGRKMRPQHEALAVLKRRIINLSRASRELAPKQGDALRGAHFGPAVPPPPPRPNNVEQRDKRDQGESYEKKATSPKVAKPFRMISADA